MSRKYHARSTSPQIILMALLCLLGVAMSAAGSEFMASANADAQHQQTVEAKKPADITRKLPVLRLSALPVHMRNPERHEARLIRRAFELAGYHLELVFLPPLRSIESAAAGITDGELLRSPESAKAYNTLVLLKPVLLTYQYWVWVNPERQCPVSREALLKFKPVTILGVHDAWDIPSLSDVGYTQASNPTSAVKILKAGRADYIVASQGSLDSFLLPLDMSLKRCLDMPIFTANYHTAMNIKHRGKVKQLEAGLKQARKEVIKSAPSKAL